MSSKSSVLGSDSQKLRHFSNLGGAACGISGKAVVQKDISSTRLAIADKHDVSQLVELGSEANRRTTPMNKLRYLRNPS